MSEPAGLDRTLTPFGAVPINEEISPRDGMLVDGDTSHYFAVGRSALHCIKVSMLAAGVETFANILDLPSGYGRVLRHLHAAFPDAHLTACDIDRDGVDFCAATFGATPVYGHESPGKIDLEGDYDLIWVGSLLTHLDSRRCKAFLELFRANLRRNGRLVLTLHGRAVADRMTKGVSDYGLGAAGMAELLTRYATAGFGYASYPATVSSVGENYGISLTWRCWAYDVIKNAADLRLLGYTEQGWDNHQDVVTLMRV